MTALCPRCADVTDDDLARLRARRRDPRAFTRLTRTERTLARLLFAHMPDVVPSQELHAAIDSLCENAVRVVVYRMRPKLAPGIRIVNQSGLGYRMVIGERE